jgi:CDP-4-dehydro-6-deoxyglucose reductase
VGTNYLFHQVEKNSVIKVSKALGKFHLPEIIDLDICFVCTGTGIAPLRSMLFDIFNKNTPHKNLYLIFGNRTEKDILYRKELEHLEQKHPEFKFIPVLSRDTNWKGYKGYVHKVYEKMFAHHPEIYFYLCGWHNMLGEAKHRLAEMGYDKKHVKSEVYD